MEDHLLACKIPPDLKLLQLEQQRDPTEYKMGKMRSVSSQFYSNYDQQVASWRQLKEDLRLCQAQQSPSQSWPTGSIQHDLDQIVCREREERNISRPEQVYNHLADLLETMNKLCPQDRSHDPASQRV